MSHNTPSTLQVACIQLHWAKPVEYNINRTQHYIRAAADSGARVALFPEANLTSYYFPYVVELDPKAIKQALDKSCESAAKNNIWVIVGTIQKTDEHFLNLMHVIDPAGRIVHEYAKINMAGRDEKKVLSWRQQVITI